MLVHYGTEVSKREGHGLEGEYMVGAMNVGVVFVAGHVDY